MEFKQRVKVPYKYQPAPDPVAEEDMFTYAVAARMLGMEVDSMLTLCDEGELEERYHRITRTSMDMFLVRCKRGFRNQ